MKQSRKKQAPTVLERLNTLGMFYLEDEHKIYFTLEVSKLFSAMLRDSLKYIFMPSWHKFKSKQDKKDKILYK